MRVPIQFRQQLVYKASASLNQPEKKHNFRVKEVSCEDIVQDPWLYKRRITFEKMLKEGHTGLIVLNENDECVAYGWIAMGNLKPSHLPKIPEHAAWCHYGRVRTDHRGQGLHRLMLQERIKLIREKYGNLDIYSDTSQTNIPSRINHIRVGFVECGIYYTLKIGTKKIPFLHLLLGKWFRKAGHPEIPRKN